ncbi:MAG: hypothetical protein IPJ02_15525 [Chitinophagaceae bacterium]|nr:hypothetical protein [Chitinophagaceae bacterium]
MATHVTCSGHFNGTADFDPNVGTMNLTSNGSIDAFAAKYSPCLLMSTPGSISGNPTVCSGSSNIYSIPAVTGATSYTWTLPSGWTGNSSTTSINATAGATGGIISVAANNSCGISPLQSLIVSVIPTSTPTLNISANPPGAICSGTSVTFTATTGNTAGGTINYDFKINGSSVQNGASNTYTTNTLTNGNIVSCDISISGGTCLTTNTATSNTITMVVNPNLIPSVNITANPGTTICFGSSVTFTATPNNGGPAPGYQWQVNGGNVGTNASTYTTNSVANGDNVTVIITSSLTCASPSSATSNTITMVVNPNLIPSVNITANPGTTVCSGTSVTFTAVAGNTAGGTVTYDFKINGGSVQNSGSNTYTTNTLTNGNIVSCDINISGGTCLTTNTATSNTIAMTVNSNSTPSVSIIANPGTTVCSGTSVTFTATAGNTGGGIVNYNFKVNGISVQNSGSNMFITSTLINGDAVSCDISITGGTCLTSTVASSNTITMSVTAVITPSVGIVASSTTACVGTSVTFTANPTNGGANPSYQWKINGVNAGANSPVFTTTTLANGDLVTVNMSSSLACASPTSVTSNTVTMVVNPNITPVVNITANPSGTICSGTSVAFTAVASNTGGGGITYDFKVNGTSVQNSPLNILTTATLNNGNTVTCDITIVGGACLTSTTASSNSITMVVNPNITSAVNITAIPSGTICSGTLVTFTAATTNTGGGTVNYNFKVNGTSIQSGPLNTFATTSLINGNNVTCDITISSGTCLAVNTASSNTITISVNSSPNPVINITANPSGAICTGIPVTFTAIPANVGTTPAFQWQLNGINVSGNGLTYANNSLSDGDKVNCIMSTVSSCSITPFVYSDTIIMIVKPVPLFRSILQPRQYRQAIRFN